MTSPAALGPIAVLVAGGLLVLLLEAFARKTAGGRLALVSVLAVGLAAAWAVRLWGTDSAWFDGALSLDRPALLAALLILASAALTVGLGLKGMALQSAPQGEFYGLLLFAAAGLLIMTSSSNLLVIFLGLEVFSVSGYALAGLATDGLRGPEAAAKYFLMGGFASAFLVFGLALLFGARGSLEIAALGRAGGADGAGGPLAAAGIALVLAGFAFKVALVPFHMWAPDVYQGAPTPVTAFFSTAPKAAGFFVLWRLLEPVWASGGPEARTAFVLLWGVSALTMIVGNLTALRQTDVKRMLAYSSISHAGYALIAVLSRDPAALAFYLAVYLFMGLGAFGALSALGRPGREAESLDGLSGLGFKAPWLAIPLTACLVSLAGFPPLGGFLAKFYVFTAAARQDLVALVVIGVLTSLVSVYYYLRVVVHLYMREPAGEVGPEAENPAAALVLFLCVYGVLQLGLFPGNTLLLIRRAFGG